MDTASRPRSRSASPALVAARVIGGFVALLWIIEALDASVDNRLDGYGIEPRDRDGLIGVVLAPLLHGSWGHLAANTVPVILLGFLVFLGGAAYGHGVTAVIWLVAGLGVWFTAPDDTLHLGASSLVFGWLTCLLVRGFVSRSIGQLAIAVLVFVLYGGALWGVLPGQPGVSWQGHLFGAIGGVLAALLLTDRKR